jgi:putative NADPH-quinone reductase
MDILTLVCHPQPASYSHALAAVVGKALQRKGHRVLAHDLYLESFDPVLSEEELTRRFTFDEQVQHYWAELAEAAGLIIVHPDWWGQPPALLKGWVDRVLSPGVAYAFEGEEFAPKRRVPLFEGKKALVFSTTDAREGEEQNTLPIIWVERIFRFCGIQEAACHLLYGLHDSPLPERHEFLEFAVQTAVDWFPADGGRLPTTSASP